MSRPISRELVLSPDFWISNIPRYFSFAWYLYFRRHTARGMIQETGPYPLLLQGLHKGFWIVAREQSGNNWIYHHIAERTRESDPSVHDLQSSPRLAKVVDVANHGQYDGIPLSIPRCGDWLWFSHAKTALPMVTSCYRKYHDVIMYLARNDGAKMLSHPRDWWYTLGWDNISPDVQIVVQICLQLENQDSRLKQNRSL